MSHLTSCLFHLRVCCYQILASHRQLSFHLDETKSLVEVENRTLIAMQATQPKIHGQKSEAFKVSRWSKLWTILLFC